MGEGKEEVRKWREKTEGVREKSRRKGEKEVGTFRDRRSAPLGSDEGL